MPTPRCSVVVPTYGRAERIATLLRALDGQSLPAEDFEVVVVDDGTPEPIALDVGAHRYALKPLRQKNAGPGAARNLAFRHCDAPLVLILNDDAVPARDLLAGHLAAHAAAPPKTAVLGRFPFSDAALRHPFVQLIAGGDLLFPTSGLRDGARHDWRYFWTCNLSLPLSALREVGGFDEDFREAVQEDVELGYRLQARGFEVLYRDALHCAHDHVITPEAYFHRMQRYGTNLIHMWRKHGDPGILGAGHADHVEPLLQSLQLKFEKLRDSFPRSVESLTRLESAYGGTSLPEKIAADARRVVELYRWVPIARGVSEALHGRDPELAAARGPEPGMLTSIVLVSYDALDHTRACLEALRSTAEPELPTEILVVDNGSSDGSLEYLRAQRDVELIENGENRGAPHARNQAIPRARGAWLVFLDNDVTVYPGWLRRLRHHAEIDSAVGCVVPTADRAAHGQQVATPPWEHPRELAAFAADTACAHHRVATYKRIFSSLLVLVRREVVEKIGGFDEQFSPWGFEDDDFSLRSHLAGYRARLAHDVFVHHAAYGGPKSERHRRLLERNWRRFASKWHQSDEVAYGSYEFLEDVLRQPWSERLHVPVAAGAQAGVSS